MNATPSVPTVIFIDSRVAGYDELLGALPAGAEVHRIDAGSDGLAQMAAVLAGRSDIGAVHIVSHGAAGEVRLGTTTLTADSIAAHAGELAGIGAALADDGDLLLYGCESGAGTTGAALVAALAQYTGADVAASTDVTGAAALGGNWLLERSSGTIEAAALGSDGALAGYAGTLATSVTFDFESGVVGDTVPDGEGPRTASQTKGGVTLTLTADTGVLEVLPEGAFTGDPNDPAIDRTMVAVDFQHHQPPNNIELRLNGGQVFDFTSFAVLDWGGADTMRITTDKGFVDIDTAVSGIGEVVVLPNNPLLKGVLWARLSDADNSDPFIIELDNIVLSNISQPNVAPSFVGATTSLNAVQNGGAVNLAGLLHVSDVDAGQTLTWSQSGAPAHGTLSVSSATAATGSSDITPGGTLTYVPAAGYTGTDTFTVQVSDGSATATRTISVNVNPLRPGAPDLVAPSDTGISSTDNVTAANTMAFTGTSAPGDTTSTVRVFIDLNGNGVYNAGEATNTATVSNGGWTVAGVNTGALASGTYNVYSIVTSATGALTSTASTPLAITVDHTAPAITFGGIGISNDTGTSGSDFNTNAAAQTITATLSGALAAGDVVYGSVDNGSTWVDVTSKVSGTALTWTGATLVAGGGIRLRVNDEHGNQGTAAVRAYTLDTTAPAQTLAAAALSADTGAGATDFITNTPAQTISGTLSGVTAAGDIVEVSLNNGSTWTAAANTTGTNSWSLANQTLAGSNTLQVRVTDAAGNHGSAQSQAYVVDTSAPTAAVPATTNLIAPSGTSFALTVTYSDSGGSSIDPGTFGTGNLTFTAPGGGTLSVSGFAASGNSVTYTVQAPGGSWDAGDAGAYTVALAGNSVRDVAGNAVAANAAAGTINVAFSTAPAVGNLALSNDSGISATDFVTNAASQTVTATLSGPIGGGSVWGSLDNGATWVDITSKVSGTAVNWNGVTLAGSGTLVIKATDGNGQDGIVASHAYVLDTAAPAQTVATASLSADSGLRGNDFITNVAAQNLTGTLSAPLAAGDTVEVSLDNGAHWTTAAASAGSNAWALPNQTLAGSDMLQVRVTDTAGNHGPAYSHQYTIDTVAPTAGTPVRADIFNPSGRSFPIVVTYSDAESGIEPVTLNGGNLTVTGPRGPVSIPSYSVVGNTVTYLADAPGGNWSVWDYGTWTVAINGNTVKDLAGNGIAANPGAHTFTVLAPPTATVSISDTALTAGETTTVVIVFSQPVADLDIGDMTTPNGALSGLVTMDGGYTWAGTLTPAANTTAASNVITLNMALVHGTGGVAGAGTVQSNSYAVQTGSGPQPQPQPQPPTGTVDGVPVTSTQQTDPGTGIVNTTVTVPVVTSTRTDDPSTPNKGLADIALAATKGGVGAALTVSLPVGTGLDVSGPATLLTNQEALLDLIRRIEQKTTTGSDVQQQMTGEGTSFLDNLLASTLLQTATVTPTAPAFAAGAILINGSAATDAAVQGIVLDARQVGPNVTLQLDNVAFAAIVGAATLRGGAGSNIVIGDDASQSIFLGPEDDQLSGGGGDDVIGSAGGNDVLAGDAGNDAVAGGIGNDSLAGGTGNDVLQGGRSDRGHWDFTLAADGTLGAGHQTLMFAPTGAETLARTELDARADALAFMSAGAATLRDIALLYHGAFGRAADLSGLNFYVEHGASLTQVAQSFARSPEWATSSLNAATDSAFVQALYQQVLGRAGDTAGTAYWLGKLAGTGGPALSRADVLVAFATGSEHRAHYADGVVVAAADVTAEQGWIAGSGDDRLEGGTGNDVLVGGDGIDTAVFAGKQSDWGLLVRGGAAVVLTNAAAGDADTVSGIERGEFADGTLDLSFTQDGQVETLGLLYQAVLDRAADLPGIAWWAGQHLSAAQLAGDFTQSAEFRARFDGMSDSAFVRTLYANSGLAADAAGGAASWVTYLEHHTRAELIGTWIGQDAVLAAQLTATGV